MDYLEKTYKEFAERGIKGLTPLVSNNDRLENLIHKLLSLHIDKLDHIALLIEQKNYTYPELFELLAEYPDQIKFNKHLFTHRANSAMNLCFLYAIRTLKPITIPLFKSYFKLSEEIEYYDSIWMTMVEAWYSALDINNLTAKQMERFSEEIAEQILNKL